jgi:formylglycine-generating enzyme required for sulfatase activity
MLSRPAAMFATAPEEYAAHPVPGLEEWSSLWKAWDTVTRQMIPDEELNEKPIKLRNACIFYLGHIPTFLDMKIVEGTKLPPTDPAYYTQIFERGIDPDVDNPEHVHAHSEIPDEYPPLNEILDYQDRVRQRVADLYKTGQAYSDAWTGRVMWLGFEHEAMHLETLLYMLLQSDKTLPPAGTVKPDFEQLAFQAKQAAVENEWFEIPAQKITIGIDDPDTADGPLRHFGWDVEKPVREADVKALKAKARPITNEEYARYLSDTGKHALPASWKLDEQSNGDQWLTNDEDKLASFLHGKSVRTVYGSVPLKLALDWPVSASYDELAGCAAYMGGRIPTMEETRSIYSFADGLKKAMPQKLEKAIPAVNGCVDSNNSTCVKLQCANILPDTS